MNQPRTFQNPFDLLPLNEQISEICYKRLVELAKVGYMAINKANPMEARKASLQVEGRYQEAHRQVKQHLNFYKKVIREEILPFAQVIRHRGVYDASEDRSTQDFRNLISGQYTMMCERLKDYAPLLMPSEDVPAFLTTLGRVFARELDTLLTGGPGEGLAWYEAAPRFTQEDYA